MSLTASVSEVLALFLAGRVLKLLGPNVSSVIILLAFSIRFSGYYYIRRPYYLICMETMHFFNFGILYVLIAQKADLIGIVELVFFFVQKSNFIISSSTTWTCWYTSRCCQWCFIWFRYDIRIKLYSVLL